MLDGRRLLILSKSAEFMAYKLEKRFIRVKRLGEGIVTIPKRVLY